MQSDEDLVRRTLAGDLAAFESLVERHAAVVHRVADDVTRDAPPRASHRLARYRGEGAFRSWLLQIAHNTAVTAFRKNPDLVSRVEESPSGDGLPAERLEPREPIARLRLELATLRPERPSGLVLRDVEGLSYDEVAA